MNPEKTLQQEIESFNLQDLKPIPEHILQEYEKEINLLKKLGDLKKSLFL